MLHKGCQFIPSPPAGKSRRVCYLFLGLLPLLLPHCYLFFLEMPRISN